MVIRAGYAEDLADAPHVPPALKRHRGEGGTGELPPASIIRPRRQELFVDNSRQVGSQASRQRKVPQRVEQFREVDHAGSA